MENKTIIRKWLVDNEISLSEKQVDDLLKYIELVKESSAKMNLVSKNDLPQLISRHLLDSLHVLTVYDFPDSAKVADLGSGAGFPGVPLAIAHPNLQVHLVESRHRKSLFLKKVVDTLNLVNTQVMHGRWEDLNISYDIVLARAVYKKDELIEKVNPRLTPDGVLLYFAKYKQINILKKH